MAKWIHGSPNFALELDVISDRDIWKAEIKMILGRDKSSRIGLFDLDNRDKPCLVEIKHSIQKVTNALIANRYLINMIVIEGWCTELFMSNSFS